MILLLTYRHLCLETIGGQTTSVRKGGSIALWKDNPKSLWLVTFSKNETNGLWNPVGIYQVIFPSLQILLHVQMKGKGSFPEIIFKRSSSVYQQDPTCLTARRKHYICQVLFCFLGPLWVLKKYLFRDFDESLQSALEIMDDEHIGICTPNLGCV